MFPPDPTPPGGYGGSGLIGGSASVGDKIKYLTKLAEEMRDLLRDVQGELEKKPKDTEQKEAGSE